MTLPTVKDPEQRAQQTARNLIESVFPPTNNSDEAPINASAIASRGARLFALELLARAEREIDAIDTMELGHGGDAIAAAQVRAMKAQALATMALIATLNAPHVPSVEEILTAG